MKKRKGDEPITQRRLARRAAKEITRFLLGNRNASLTFLKGLHVDVLKSKTDIVRGKFEYLDPIGNSKIFKETEKELFTVINRLGQELSAKKNPDSLRLEKLGTLDQQIRKKINQIMPKSTLL
jgi:hypothetical protein